MKNNRRNKTQKPCKKLEKIKPAAKNREGVTKKRHACCINWKGNRPIVTLLRCSASER